MSIEKVQFNHCNNKTCLKPGNIAIFISKGGPGDVLLDHVAGRIPDPSEDVESVLAEVGVVPQVEKVVRHVLLGQLLQKKGCVTLLISKEYVTLNSTVPRIFRKA